VDDLPPSLTHNNRIYSKTLTEEDLVKEMEHKERVNEEKKHDKETEDEDHKKHHKYQHKNGKLQALTPRDVRVLVRAEEELSQTKMFQRIWPTKSTHHYFMYFESLPYSEKLMDWYESSYGNNRSRGQAVLSDCCQRNLHLK